jgi:hypothetical protein
MSEVPFEKNERGVRSQYFANIIQNESSYFSFLFQAFILVFKIKLSTFFFFISKWFEITIATLDKNQPKEGR